MAYRGRAGLIYTAVFAAFLGLGGPALAAAPATPADDPTADPAADAAAAVGAARANINITGGWTRATPGNATNAAIYLRIANVGMEAERLIGARAAMAERTEIHTGGMENGVMRMAPVESMDIPPEGSVVFEPNGNHLMLTGIRAPLQEGDSFLTVLEFENGGSQTVSVRVLAADAMGLPAIAGGNARDITSGVSGAPDGPQPPDIAP